MTTETQITWPEANCCSGPDGCMCGDQERSLRGWRDGQAMPAMTAEQREWCLREIEQVEGHARVDHEADSDALLANAVLNAWTDFCRDKGLL